MTVQSHISSLEKKHQALEDELAKAHASPSTDDATLTSIKRRKLRVKDEIAGLMSRA